MHFRELVLDNGKKLRLRQMGGYGWNLPGTQLFVMEVRGKTEPGRRYKVLLVSALLKEGGYTPIGTLRFCSGPFSVEAEWTTHEMAPLPGEQGVRRAPSKCWTSAMLEEDSPFYGEPPKPKLRACDYAMSVRAKLRPSKKHRLARWQFWSKFTYELNGRAWCYDPLRWLREHVRDIVEMRIASIELDSERVEASSLPQADTRRGNWLMYGKTSVRAHLDSARESFRALLADAQRRSPE